MFYGVPVVPISGTAWLVSVPLPWGGALGFARTVSVMLNFTPSSIRGPAECSKAPNQIRSPPTNIRCLLSEAGRKAGSGILLHPYPAIRQQNDHRNRAVRRARAVGQFGADFAAIRNNSRIEQTRSKRGKGRDGSAEAVRRASRRDA